MQGEAGASGALAAASLKRSPAFRRWLGRRPFPLRAVAADGGGVELARGAGFFDVIDREHDFLAGNVPAAQRAVDDNLTLLIGLDRNVVDCLPASDRTDRQRSCRRRNTVLFALVYLAFGILQARARRGLHAQPDSRRHTGIARDTVRDGSARDTRAGRCALRQHGGAAGKTRCHADGREEPRRKLSGHDFHCEAERAPRSPVASTDIQQRRGATFP